MFMEIFSKIFEIPRFTIFDTTNGTKYLSLKFELQLLCVHVHGGGGIFYFFLIQQRVYPEPHLLIVKLDE